MATNHTQNYQLNLWAPTDRFLRSEFNENSQTIEDALVGHDAALANLTNAKADAVTVNASFAALQTAVNAKADVSAVTALTQTVNGKADASAVTALTQTVNGKADKSALNALTQTVAGKGNCTILFGSYTGTGTYGKDNPNILDFADTMGKAPVLIYISELTGGEFHILALRGMTRHASAPNGGSTYFADISWTETGLSWYSASSLSTQLNQPGRSYSYCALFD